MVLTHLFTRFSIPPTRPGTVYRARLHERLDAGVSGKVTVVSAPAGFGKTTLVSQWLSDSDARAAWLALQDDENDPARLLTYCILAIQTLLPAVGKGVLAALQTPQPPAAELLLTGLLNEITAQPESFILVLDDVHLIRAPEAEQIVRFLVNHLPPQMHLVLISRALPALPMARLRARGQVTELRAADLRFTQAESIRFLRDVMGVSLLEADMAALDAQIEGWAVGLQLFALALAGAGTDAKQFTVSFSGKHHFVMEYLAEEVFAQQAPAVQTFLLETAILSALCGELCDALVQETAFSGQAMLETLEAANLFLIPLDHERRWYRFHPLFAEFLRQRLLRTAPPDHVAGLHRRASQWYEDHGLDLEAFHHAAAGQDMDRAERLTEGRGLPLHLRGAAGMVLNWLDSLPVSVLDARPWLWLQSAGLMLVNGRTTGVEARLSAAEAALEKHESLPADVKSNLSGRLAVVRATLALTRYDDVTMLAQSRQALALLPARNVTSRATALWTQGHAHLFQRDYTAAEPLFQESVRLAQTGDDTFITILSTIGLGLVQEGQYQLHRAAAIYHTVLQQAGDQPLETFAEAHLGLARIYYQWNDLTAAEHHGRLSLELTRRYDRVIDRFVVSEVFLALLWLAQGDVAGAAARVLQTRSIAREQGFTRRLPELTDAQVRILLRQRDVVAAAALVESPGLPLSQARVYLAQGKPVAALDVLARYGASAGAQRWPEERLRIGVLQALALHANGAAETALAVLGDIFSQTEAQGVFRLYLDEGQPMVDLLRLVQQYPQTDYAQRLLEAFHAEPVLRSLASPASPPLVEALTERELNVLRLVSEGLSNREICDQLYLALDTVKGHNRRIFEKLHVRRRTEAVARARDLGLI